MRRISLCVVFVGIVALVGVAVPASAAKPSGRCPVAFTAQDVAAFTAARIAAGAPDPEAGPEIFEGIDANDNGRICVRPLPDNPGTPAWFVNALDDKLPA